MTLFAALPPLRERLGWRRAGCVLGGFCGSLLIFRPGAGVFNPWSLVVLLSATLAAIVSAAALLSAFEVSACGADDRHDEGECALRHLCNHPLLCAPRPSTANLATPAGSAGARPRVLQG